MQELLIVVGVVGVVLARIERVPGPEWRSIPLGFGLAALGGTLPIRMLESALTACHRGIPTASLVCRRPVDDEGLALRACDRDIGSIAESVEPGAIEALRLYPL